MDEHAPGVPKILVGNRLHLAYKRQVCETLAENYASKNDMAFFEVSPLCDFNIVEVLAGDLCPSARLCPAAYTFIPVRLWD